MDSRLPVRSPSPTQERSDNESSFLHPFNLSFPWGEDQTKSEKPEEPSPTQEVQPRSTSKILSLIREKLLEMEACKMEILELLNQLEQ